MIHNPKRGEIYWSTTRHGKPSKTKILGPEDFDGYYRNHPGPTSELLEKFGKRTWGGKRSLFKTKKQAEEAQKILDETGSLP